MKPNAFVIFITVGKAKVLWAGQRSINQLINVLPAAPLKAFVSRKILSVGQFISVSYLVYRFIGIENDRIQILSDHNDTTCKKQQ